MNLNIPPPAIAAGRHVLSYTAGVITAAAALHVITPGDADKLTSAFSALATGVTTIAGAVATIVAIVSGTWASFSATNRSNIDRVASLGNVADDVTARQALINAVAANPAIAKIVTTPEIAKDSPSEKVVAQ